MPYVASTLASDQQYIDWDKNTGGNGHVARPAVPKMKVLVRGGANVMGQIHTPEGILTKITDAEAAMLEQNEAFKKHKARGVVKILNREVDPDKIARDMPKDAGEKINGEWISGGSSQLTAADFKEGERAGGIRPGENEKSII